MHQRSNRLVPAKTITRIMVMDGMREMTPERAIELAERSEAEAVRLGQQGLIISARRTRKTAREWREIAATLLVQGREEQGR